MSRHRGESDALAETQFIRKVPARPADGDGGERGQAADHAVPAQAARARHRAPSAEAPGDDEESDPGAVTAALPTRPAEQTHAGGTTPPAPTASPAPTAPSPGGPAEAGVTFIGRPHIHVPEGFTAPEAAPFAAPARPAARSAQTRRAARRPAAEPGEAETAGKPAGKPAKAAGAHTASKQWQERVPFDDTGVLLRPELLRHRAMNDETELLSAVGGPQDDGSEAAQAQRPGFWTGAWPRRALLAVLLLMQTVLTLRNNNTAFEDEALYLYSGHLELGHLLYGTPTGADFWSYFSGAPTLYPVLGAIADQTGGLFTARLLALAFMLGATGLLYLLTRRLFGTRAALCAAGLYCCTEGTVVVGGLATYDAPALFLLALAAWIVVRFAESNRPVYLAAAFPAALAVGTKYAALMFVPIVIALALLTSLPRFGWWAAVRPVALGVASSLLIWTGLKIAGPGALAGVRSTTTSRAQGTDPSSLVLRDSAEWSGVVFAVALVGALFLIRLPATHRHAALPTKRAQRVLLAVLLAGSGLLAPAYQMHLHTAVSLQKHVAFGLLFAAPLAGYGLIRMVGPNFHRAQLGIAVAVVTFALGMQQSLEMFHVWPNSDVLLDEIVRYQQPDAHYLVGSDEVAIYGLRGDPDAEPDQFSNTFFFGYVDDQGRYITGDQAYTEAVAAGYFRLIAYTGNDSPSVERLIAEELYRSPAYKLVAKIPEAESTGTTYYYIWVHR